jgi:hypothetical protein
VATKNGKLLLMVDGKARAMCKEADKASCITAFEPSEILEGTYKRGKPDGMTAQIEGVFTATDGRTFLVYVDWSANSIEAVDEKGYPKD